MGRRARIDRPIKFGVVVPQSILEKVDQQLYSELEGRVPYGAKSELVTSLMSDWLRARGVAV